MIRFISRAIAALLCGFAALPAAAAFHLWSMTELYSNADGTVQFIELVSPASGERFLSGQSITSTSGGSPGTVNTFTFPSNLSGDTANKRLLIATQGFADLGIVAPDYVVPNGFLFRAGGRVNFAGVDAWTHGALPAGPLSLNRDGTTGANSPTNFGGGTGTVLAEVLANHTALWWNPAEPGWGLNLNHQGDTVFATLFTYSPTGEPMWLVMSNGVRQSGQTFTGELFRTTGPAFNADPFTPIGPGNITSVGTMTVTLNGDTGTLNYTVNGVAVSKAIFKQVFGSRAADCISTTGDRSAVVNYQDLWFNPNESGWGVNLAHQDNILFATLFNYDAAGQGVWWVMSNGARQVDGSYSGTLFRTRGPAFNAVPFTPIGPADVTAIGTMRFTFADGESATLTYTVNGTSVTKSITRQVFGTTRPACS